MSAIAQAVELVGLVKLKKPVRCSACRRVKRWASILQDARLASRGWFRCNRHGCQGVMREEA